VIVDEAGTLAGAFLAAAERFPDTVAVAGDGTDPVTYAQLRERAAAVAARLAAAGTGRGDVVAVHLPLGTDLVVAQLAAVWAGAPFLPLDPAVPPARNGWLARQAGAVAVVARDAPWADTVGLAVLAPDGTGGGAEPVPVTGEELAYVVTTSGSTGRPKGIEVTHRSLDALLAWTARAYPVPPGTALAAFASPAFDISIWEIWRAVRAGATLVVPDPAARLDPVALLASWARHGVAEAFLPSPIAREVYRTPVPDGLGLTTLFIGGDVAPPTPPLPYRVVNLYGPAETTIIATGTVLTPGGDRPIGTPVDGTRAEVLDDALHRTAAGELYLGGDCLARGYRNRPDLTADRFVPDPYGPPGARLYRTGDRVRRRPDGGLDYLGRRDEQVKIRGVRVELGEVTAAVLDGPEVADALALAVEHPVRGTALIAAYTPRDAGSAAALDRYLRERLPAAMVPRLMPMTPGLPRLPSGKYDRAALERSALVELDRPLPQPETGGLLDTVLDATERVLGVRPADPEADLFSLGAHSLALVRLVRDLTTATGAALGIADVLAEPTVRAVADRLAGAAAVPARPVTRHPDRDRPQPLTFAQEQVFFLDQLAPSSRAYTSAFRTDMAGRLDPAILRCALDELIRRHEALRSTVHLTPDGPVQQVHQPYPAVLDEVDLRALPEAERGDRLDAEIRRRVRVRVDTEVLPPVRWTLFTLGPRHSVLLQVEHHVVHDGWTLGLVYRDLTALYTALADGCRPDLPEPAAQVADLARWQRAWLATDPLAQRQLAYWQAELADPPPPLEVGDLPRPARQGFTGEALVSDLPPALYPAAHRLGTELGSSTFAVFLAAFALTVSAAGGQPDLVVGTAAAGRSAPGAEDVVGMVLNTVAVRLQIDPTAPFTDTVRHVARRCRAALANGDVPFQRVVGTVGGSRATGGGLYRVMFSFHDSPVPALRFAGTPARIRLVHNGSAKADLNVVVVPRAAQGAGPDDEDYLELVWEYDTEVLSRERAGQLRVAFVALLRQALADPHRQHRTDVAPAGGTAMDRPAPARVPDAPVGAVQTVRECVGAVLGLDRVPVDRGFLELGGDSLLAVRLMGRLSDRTGVRVPVAAILDAPTIAALAGALAGAAATDAAPPPIRPRGGSA
jgi:amino acid adenylation domain-containing protein